MKNKSHIEVWNECLGIIEDILPPTSYKTWFEPIVPVRLDDSNLSIKVPSMYFVEYLEEHFIGLLKKTLRRVIGPTARLSYEPVMVQGNTKNASKSVSVPTQNKIDVSNHPVEMPMSIEKRNQIKNPFVIPGIQKLNIDSRLNPLYSFDNFVEGECNRLARSAGLNIAQNPGTTTFNPLFIYGGSGMGKSHLAHAIGIQVKEHNPDKMVLYVDSQQFQQQFVDARQANEINDFINFYRMIDVLIIDDVHSFAQGNKPKTQEAFFHIFNYLHQSFKQIILTSDKAPSELQGLEQRLLSRFKWGLVAELEKPSYETRLAILKHRLYRDGIELNSDIQKYLAKYVTTNIREMEGALISLLAHSTLSKSEITLNLAQDLVDKFVRNTRKTITMDSIQNTVCSHFKITLEELKSKTRRREIVQARQIAMYFAKSLTKESLATIGTNIGGKDHATVLHACKTIKNLMETDRHFRENVQEIEKTFKS
ncbi:MAG: chromosomal replication initiator protein DnaA [Salinivirgaceae bacterium]|nr:chromosomal replication initiator protein DnaA [Salinivirgaceae bacterium]MDD4745745.1 chromosomal replication initiator protein DnaA [Salinivirgaceae bacterium]MDY0279286.1 chromosomal replication initiator protein DnaA [Salinivirgaceae bacterium]